MPPVTGADESSRTRWPHDHRIHEGRQHFMHISMVPRPTAPRLAAAGVSLAIAGTLLGAGLAGSDDDGVKLMAHATLESSGAGVDAPI